MKEEKGLYEAGWVLFFIFALLWVGIEVFHLPIWMPPCIVHKWTRYYCPGCGGTRAMIELLKGHFVTSLYYHPVVLYGAVLYGWFMISHTISYLSRGKLQIGMKYSNKYLYVGFIIIMVQWILKNLVKAVWGIGIL